MIKAMQKITKELHGSYSFAVIDKNNKDNLYAVCNGCPLLVGIGIDEYFLSSDSIALSILTNRFIALENKEIAKISIAGVTIFDENLNKVEKDVSNLDFTSDKAEKGEFTHFMNKEIHEQPRVIEENLNNRVSAKDLTDDFISTADIKSLQAVEHVRIIACGTSYNAGLIAKHWFEQIVHISCDVIIASEYNKDGLKFQNDMVIAVSQSGETADTISAFSEAIKSTDTVCSACVCNVSMSHLARIAQIKLITLAGPEIGVASTKAFTAQLVSLMILCLTMAKHKGIENKETKNILSELIKLPELTQKVIKDSEAKIPAMLDYFTDKSSALFLGKGIMFPIAIEGSLKLKEVSYIHAEAYPAGELKHGPLALVNNKFPIVALVNTKEEKKMLISIEEVISRGASVIVVATSRLSKKIPSSKYFIVPKTHPLLSPILFNIPLQILSYHVACERGTDVDQPRNLAKSVTVS
jgi:glucosamine--fructose-6-phosphate aminotransferase (isomerizing)